MKETFYFSHDYNARDDEKIINMLADLWMEWYWIYWWLLEILAQNNWQYSLESIKWLAHKLWTSIENITRVITLYNLFITEDNNKIFYNKRLLEHIQNIQQNKQKKAEAGKIWMAKRWWPSNKSITPVITEDNTAITKHNKLNYIKLNKIKINNKKNISKDIWKKEIITTKVVTLKELIKQEFTQEFIDEVYKKFNLTKNDFIESSEGFVLYWTEKNQNWIKERWEKEKTFDVKLRYRTRIRNSSKWNKANLSNKKIVWITSI